MNNSTQQPLLADVRAELGALGAELRETASARWELARLEVEADLFSAKRLAVAWLVALVMSLTSLPLIAVWMADVLAELTATARGGWLLGFAAALLLLSSASTRLPVVASRTISRPTAFCSTTSGAGSSRRMDFSWG